MKNKCKFLILITLIVVPFIFTSCAPVMNYLGIKKKRTYYTAEIFYYVFIDDNETIYTDSICKDEYMNNGYDDLSSYFVTRGNKRRLYETYSSIDFGKALYKSIVTDEKTETVVYYSCSSSKYYDSLPESHDANFTITIADEDLSVNEVITGEFKNTGDKESVQECTINNEKLGSIHVLCVYDYSEWTEEEEY
ncbi:MAG: hypothetical protein WCQ67_06855 [Treponema sp.]